MEKTHNPKILCRPTDRPRDHTSTPSHPDLTTLLPMKKLLLNTNFDLMKKEKLGRLDESDKASEQPDVSSFIFNLMDSG